MHPSTAQRALQTLYSVSEASRFLTPLVHLVLSAPSMRDKRYESVLNIATNGKCYRTAFADQ